MHEEARSYVSLGKCRRNALSIITNPNAEFGKTNNRKAHPLHNGERYGVPAHVVTELVGEYSRELILSQVINCVRRNDE